MNGLGQQLWSLVTNNYKQVQLSPFEISSHVADARHSCPLLKSGRKLLKPGLTAPPPPFQVWWWTTEASPNYLSSKSNTELPMANILAF